MIHVLKKAGAGFAFLGATRAAGHSVWKAAKGTVQRGGKLSNVHVHVQTFSAVIGYRQFSEHPTTAPTVIQPL
jgi:hypothetical protein